MTGSVIATYYDKYGELLRGPEDQLMFDNDEIAGNVRNTGKAKDARDGGKAEDGGVGGNTKVAGEAGNAGDPGKSRDAKDKEAGRGNDRVVDGRD